MPAEDFDFFTRLREAVRLESGTLRSAEQIAEMLRAARNYRWLGLYEVTPKEIGAIAWTGTVPPAFPRFPLSQGLCGAAVAAGAIVNVGDVRKDPRWLTTFGNTRAEIIVPVFDATGNAAGLIDVESDQAYAFNADDERFLAACAPVILPIFRR